MARTAPPGMEWQHYSHDAAGNCSAWCYYRLPARRHATITHGHDEGECCLPGWCYYKPTHVGTIKRWWRRWAGAPD